MTEDKKNDGKFQDGTYLGKIFKKAGSKNGKDWKQYQLQFQVGEKTWNFWAFNSLKGLDTLEDGKTYSVGYSEKEITKNDEKYTVKNAYWLGIAKGKKDEDTQIELDMGVVTKDDSVLSDDETRFVEAYRKKAPVSLWNKNHFLGTVIRTLKKMPDIERWDAIFEKYIKKGEE